MALLAYLKSLFILQLLMGFVFVVSGLIINFIQLCTCVLWPINKQLYRRINCRLSYSLWSREYTLVLLFFYLHTIVKMHLRKEDSRWRRWRTGTCTRRLLIHPASADGPTGSSSLNRH